MSGNEPRNEGRDPEDSSVVPSGKSNSEDNTKQRQRAKKIAHIPGGICAWIVEFLKPANVVVLLLFVATIALWWSTDDLVTDAKNTSEKSLRAWIVPTGASFFETPTADFPRIRIDITNIGKEPALAVQEANNLSFTDGYGKNQSGVAYIDSEIVKWPTTIECDRSKKLEPIGPIYPSENTYYIRQGFTDGHFKELQRRERILIVFGCFLYKDTFGKDRQSPYCFFTVPSSKPFKDWTFAPCLKRAEGPE
jgi:hypothetical protein